MPNRPVRFLIRISAFVRKEVLAIVRQPRLLFSLILGPFLILLLFGIGYRDTSKTLRTLFVIPEGSTVRPIVEQYSNSLTDRIELMGITSDPESADRQLRDREIDLVVVTPLDPMADWEGNEQSLFTLYHAEIDPLESTYIEVLGNRTAEAINREVLFVAAEEAKKEALVWQAQVDEASTQATTMREALERGDATLGSETAESIQQDLELLSLAAGSSMILLSSLNETTNTNQALPADDIRARIESLQENVAMLSEIDPDTADLSTEIAQAEQVEADLARVDELLTQFQEIDSNVLVAPFRSETLNVTTDRIAPTHFYIPAVIALLLQHIAVTLSGLSIVGDKRGGTMEYFQAAPVSAFETLIGKYISFFILTAVLGAVLTALVILALGMPMLGSWLFYSIALTGLLGASLGIGFLISLAAENNSQAIQYAMILLLASIFFSGFFLPLYRLWQPVHIISWLLPATYGTSLLQSIMLRDLLGNILHYGGLLLLSLVLFIIAWLRLRRQMARL